MSSTTDWYRDHDLLLREVKRSGWRTKTAPKIPGYEDLHELRRGGQGVVYSAIQRSTRRKVAIKVLLAGAWACERHRARFEREIDLIADLQHPNIVRLYDRGLTESGHPYYVMEFIDGAGLDELIAGSGGDTATEFDQPLDVRTSTSQTAARPPASQTTTLPGRSIRAALELFAKVCEAVGYAHQRGMIHRDIKPSNIRIDTDGEPHVLDFGLAKSVVSVTDDSASVVMSQTGEFMGSLPWASPEQTDGVPARIDVRTDVYSLGVTLFQMLTGRFPYAVAGSFRQVLDNIKQLEPRRPRSLRVDLDDEVETIVLKCLAKEPDQRYLDAGELARDIRRYLAGEPIEAKRTSTTYRLRKRLRRHRATALLSAVLVLVVGISAIGALRAWRSGYWSSTTPRSAEELTVATGGWRDKDGIWHVSENARLQPADISASDLFGEYTAITAEPEWRILVSAPRYDDLGAVFVYRFDGVNWVQETKLLGSADTERARFGSGLMIDGRTAMIGARGGLSIFEYDGSQWAPRGKLHPPGQPYGVRAERGASAQQDDSGNLVVSLYRREANDTPEDYADDDWVEETRFKTPAGVVRTTGVEWAAEGMLLVKDNGCAAGQRGCESGICGSVRVFREDSNAPEGWRLEATLVGHDAEPPDSFAHAVVTDGNVIVVGAPYKEDYGRKTGAVYVFRFDGQQWFEETKLLPPGGVGDVLFGWSLAIDGDLLLVGAMTDNEGAYYTGAVHVYEFDDAEWIEKAKLVASNPRPLETFGCSVSLAAYTAVIGAWSCMNPDTRGVDLGAAYVFRGLGDRNDNGELDMIDIASGMSRDRNKNSVPDECEPFPATLSQNTTGGEDDVVLGPPDDRWYEFNTGIVEFDFGDARVVDGEGADFNVYEFESGVPEFDLIRIEVSEDGAHFVEIVGPAPTAVRLPGDGEQGRDTTRYVRSYDLAASGLSHIRYVRIVGLGDGYRHDGIGFELDAIGAIHLAPAGD